MKLAANCFVACGSVYCTYLKNKQVPVGFQVGLGTYFTAPNVNTQAIK